MHRKWLLSTKSLERYVYVSISELSMLLPSATLFFYLILRKPFKQLSQLCGLPHSIWPKVIYNWLWMRLTSIKQHSMQVRLVFMSSLICHSVCLMQVLVFVSSWRSTVSHALVLSRQYLCVQQLYQRDVGQD